LLDLLGLVLCDPEDPDRPAHLRWKQVPGTVGGGLEVRVQVGGERKVLSSRKDLPVRVALRVKPAAQRSPPDD
jgi:hypothetical protein